MAEKRASRTKAPAHLSVESARWWRLTLQEYELDPHHLRILQCAAEAWDRMRQASAELDAHGSLTFKVEGGGIRAHPAVAIERDSRIAFARMVRELGLDLGEPTAPRSPPLGRKGN